MTETLRTYIERRDLIAQKLEPYLHVSSLVPTNTEPTFDAPEGIFENSLLCNWGDPETLTTRTLYVHIYHVPDGEQKAESVREMMLEEAPPAPDQQPPDTDAYEITGQRPGEYVFVLNYVGSLRVIVGNCLIETMPRPITAPLSELVDAVLDIGRTVGCTAYVNDFQQPTIDTDRDFGVWTTSDGLIYDPRTPPQP